MDCEDGSDEVLGFCMEQCDNSYGFWCGKHDKCIHQLSMCDESRACGARSDKKSICRAKECSAELGLTRCKRSGQCVRIAELCDDDNVTPCVNAWQPSMTSALCRNYFAMMSTTPMVIYDTTHYTETTTLPPVTTTTPDIPTTRTTTTTTTTADSAMYVNGVFVDCSSSVPLSESYSGSAEPIRTVGDINAGRSICEASLYTHNILRQNHQDTAALTYDDELAAKAEEWSMYLANSNSFAHSNSSFRNGAGENLARQGSSGIEVMYGVTDSAYAWYIELEEGNYNFNTGTDSGVTGHFTQMVWSDTERVGCGVARVESGSFIYTYTTCHYYPPGNYNNQYATQVNPLVSNPFIPLSFMELEIENGGCITRSDTCSTWEDDCARYDVVIEGCPAMCLC